MTLMISENFARPRTGATADAIAFAVGTCALGELLVARSAAGVCAVLLGEEEDALEADLAARFPNARLVRNERLVADDLATLIHFVDHPDRGPDLPLDLRGTPFQRRVWEALRAIPAGRVLTYAELAGRIGEPRAVRAVAAACAANPVALAIPCHRVVRSDGSLAGYRWGVERKRALLRKEGRA
jgi:O-6-methylguanine DNA methyltransferase